MYTEQKSQRNLKEISRKPQGTTIIRTKPQFLMKMQCLRIVVQNHLVLAELMQNLCGLVQSCGFLCYVSVPLGSFKKVMTLQAAVFLQCQKTAQWIPSLNQRPQACGVLAAANITEWDQKTFRKIFLQCVPVFTATTPTNRVHARVFPWFPVSSRQLLLWFISSNLCNTRSCRNDMFTCPVNPLNGTLKTRILAGNNKKRLLDQGI